MCCFIETADKCIAAVRAAFDTIHHRDWRDVFAVFAFSGDSKISLVACLDGSVVDSWFWARQTCDCLRVEVVRGVCCIVRDIVTSPFHVCWGVLALLGFVLLVLRAVWFSMLC